MAKGRQGFLVEREGCFFMMFIAEGIFRKRGH